MKQNWAMIGAQVGAPGSVSYVAKNVNGNRLVSTVEDQLIGHVHANDVDTFDELVLHLEANNEGQVGLLPLTDG